MHFKNQQNKQKSAAFTLIELSIVLVIIGLMTGGILLGKTLIENSKITGTISQLNQYTSAVGTFKGKYDYLPGDLPNATELGFFARNGSAGYGDGNGYVQGKNADGSINFRGICGEMLLFWNDLSHVKLVDFNSQIWDSTQNQITALIGHADWIFPPTKVNSNAYVIPYSFNAGTDWESPGPLMWMIAGPYTGSDNNCNGGFTYALTPTQAYQVDAKIDDGLPITGKARGSRVNTWATEVDPNGFFQLDQYPGAAPCGNASTYNVTGADANNIKCNLAIMTGI